MAAYSFSSIKTNSDLEKVIMQLRLRQLPLTLEVINAIRKAILTPHLDEKLHKTLEREFSGQWKEIQKKHNLEEWYRNQLGQELKTKHTHINIPIPNRYEYAKKETKKSKISSSIKEITSKLKQTTQRTVKRKKNNFEDETEPKPLWKFPVKLDIPLVIDSIEQINEILDGLKEHPKSITYNLTHDILSRIKVRKVFDHYKEELRIIRQKLEIEEKKLLARKATSKRRGKWGGKEGDTFVITKASEQGSLYNNFEYGLSDWDR